MVNPDGLSSAELAALRVLQGTGPAPLADDPVWERLGADGFQFVKRCAPSGAPGPAPPRSHELTSRGYAYRTD